MSLLDGRLSAVLLAAASAVAIAWLTGFLNQYLPGPRRVALALGNLVPNRTPPPEDQFRVTLCWLQNDPKGDSTAHVAEAFTSITGVALFRSARIVAKLGARSEWLVAMQKEARAVLEEWDADLAIVGLVKKRGSAVNLWIVPGSGEGTLSRGDQPYVLEDATLGPDFHRDFRAELSAVALVAVAPLATSEARGRVLEQVLEDATTKLATLLRERIATESDEWRARLNVALGNALTTLGGRDSGTDRLERALDAYRAALEEWTRERVPLKWAEVQHNLGIALSILGERETGPARLEQAVAACRAALEERTRERGPLVWAATQNALGNALSTLAEWESGTKRLGQAVAVYCAALEERTRERVPLDWAATQSNLGSALFRLGERESGTERLEKAVVAYRASLEELSRERFPLYWAGTQYNLANVFLELGKREEGTERLEQAVAAYRAALEERTRERVPRDWAATQNQLGNALAFLGERETGTEHLRQAVVAYRASLEELSGERVLWAQTQRNLGTVLSLLGERESGTEHLEQAAAAYRAALEVFAEEAASQDRDIVQDKLTRVLKSLRERTPGS